MYRASTMARLSRTAVSIPKRMNALSQPLPRKQKLTETVLVAIGLLLFLLVTKQALHLFSSVQSDSDGEDYRQYFREDDSETAVPRTKHNKARQKADLDAAFQYEDTEEHSGSEDSDVPKRVIEPPTHLPEDFIWHVYLRLHPDVLKSGVNNQKAAEFHFMEYGRKEGRPYKLPKVYLQYTACRTLPEQIYSHMSAMVIATKLGPAELVWAPVLTPSEATVSGYEAVDASTVFDVKAIAKHWASRDYDMRMDVSKSGNVRLPLSMMQSSWVGDWDTAFAGDRYPPLPDSSLVRATAAFETLRTVRKVADALYAKIGKRQIDAAAGFDDSFEVVVQLPCLFWTIRTDSIYSTLSKKVVPSIEFNHKLVELVNRAVKKLQGFDVLVVHNTSDIQAFSGHAQETMQLYVRQLKQRFAGETCYMVFETEEANEEELGQMSEQLLLEGVCSELHTRETVFKSRELHRLNNEQQNALDLLLALKADAVGGSYFSIFTMLARELRYARYGIPRNTVVRVNDTAEHQYSAEHLFYGALLDEPDPADKVNVQNLPFSYVGRPM